MRYTIALLTAAAVVKASPFPQAVTAAISPTAPPPPGCTPFFSGSFGIVVLNISTSAPAPAKRQVTQISDGQPQAATIAHVSQIIDGQIQGGMHTVIMMPVANQIGDGQVQQQTTMAPVTQIIDGQPQAPKLTPAPAVSQKPDGQPVATSTPVATTPPASPSSSKPSSSAPPPSSATSSTTASSTSTTLVTSASSSSTSSSSSSAPSPTGPVLVACATNDTLALTLADGVLKDSKGRTGYIASNFQFQFDGPPQAGAIFTSGFTVCGNGSLALGGSTTFWQCRSGNFFNLYDRNWAPQCSPVSISTLVLQNCS